MYKVLKEWTQQNVAHLEILTMMNVFWEERVFISAASPILRLRATRFPESTLLFGGGPVKSTRFTLVESVRSNLPGWSERYISLARVFRVKAPLGEEVKSELALLRRSVNERETPNLRRGGGASRFVSSDPRGLSIVHDESNDCLEVIGVGGGSGLALWPMSGVLGRSSRSRALSLRAGQTYSIIRLPILASTCNRMGWKLSSKVS